jgi:hypothetical protein
MNRLSNFQEAVAPVITVNDSRFGLRQWPKNNEEPNIFSYSSPGKGPNGEHQN